MCFRIGYTYADKKLIYAKRRGVACCSCVATCGTAPPMGMHGLPRADVWSKAFATIVWLTDSDDDRIYVELFLLLTIWEFVICLCWNKCN